jgi:DNA polymerase-3 subunit alpha (Gram-positive type)
MLEDIKPTGFSELVRVSGFSHGTNVWLSNAQDLIRSGTAKVSETISARDDIMVYLMHKELEPGLAFKIMECVRKGKGVSPEQCTAMRAKNVPEWYIESCQKIKYMFPKAHAVAYVLMAYRIAYCKVHHPLAFYAAYFSIRADDFDADLIVQGKEVIKARLREIEQIGNKASVKEKSLQTILEVALEMFLRGFKLYSIDLYKSDPIRFQVLEDGLLPPLSALQGLGDNAAKNIAEAREQREFLSIDDLRNRSHISKTIVEMLRGHGCLAGLPESDQLALFG